MEATTARRTWAVQMLEVALSRRMCCSRVCSARRYAGRPAASTETPTRRPGSWRSRPDDTRSEEHTSELQSLMRISYAVFCLKKKKKHAERNQSSPEINK